MCDGLVWVSVCGCGFVCGCVRACAHVRARVCACVCVSLPVFWNRQQGDVMCVLLGLVHQLTVMLLTSVVCLHACDRR